jgi:hypothetical protein
MSNKHSISLSIPTPCQEDWGKMSPNDKGRHCASCNKAVIDFSLYSDRELIEFFKKTNGTVCGRLNSYQASHELVYIENTKQSFFYKLLYGTALASWLGLTAQASAQNRVSSADNTIQRNDSLKKQKTINDTCAIVEGTLKDKKTSQPLSFADVIISYSSLQVAAAVTDIDGKFKIPVSIDYLNKKLKIECAYEGYKDVIEEFTLTKHMKQKELKLEASATHITMGIIIITDYQDNTPDKTTHRSGDNPYLPPRPHH